MPPKLVKDVLPDDLAAGCLMLASKYLNEDINEDAHNLATWAETTGIEKQKLKMIEEEILFHLGYNASVGEVRPMDQPFELRNSFAPVSPDVISHEG
jgi:hypothetical protein